MQQRVALLCCWLGVACAGFTPAPPGSRPPCALKGATFCEKVELYPTKVIKNLLQSKSLSMGDFFTDESEGLNEPPDYVLHGDDIVVLQQEEEEDDRGRKVRSVRDLLKQRTDVRDLAKRCPVLSKAALPKMAANGAGEWRFIAQDELSRNTQKIQVHICEQSEECSRYCTQFYKPIPMVTVDASGKRLTKDSFWMPTSCRCQTTPLNDD